MRRRTIPAVALRTLAVMALMFVVMQGRVIGEEATPGGSPVAGSMPTPSNDYEVDGLGVAKVDTHSPGHGWRNEWDQNVALTRVTLEPGAGISKDRAHQGSSVLFVERGTICYQVSALQGASLLLFGAPDLEDNPQPLATPDPALAGGCPEPPEGCLDNPFGCNLSVEGVLTVVVQAGQSILQSTAPDAHVLRGYTNISTETAVIWIAQLQTETGESAPCGGGCP